MERRSTVGMFFFFLVFGRGVRISEQGSDGEGSSGSFMRERSETFQGGLHHQLVTQEVSSPLLASPLQNTHDAHLNLLPLSLLSLSTRQVVAVTPTRTPPPGWPTTAMAPPTAARSPSRPRAPRRSTSSCPPKTSSSRPTCRRRCGRSGPSATRTAGAAGPTPRSRRMRAC